MENEIVTIEKSYLYTANGECIEQSFQPHQTLVFNTGTTPFSPAIHQVSLEQGTANVEVPVHAQYCTDNVENVAHASLAGPEVPYSFTFHTLNDNHQDTKAKQYMCLECNIGFLSPVALKKHNLKDHSGDIKPFTCQDCGLSFSQNNSYIEHLKTHSDSEEPELYSCPKCAKTFTEKSDLNSHMKSHKASKSIICKECNTTFHSKITLRKHSKIHEKQKIFSCLECDKKFMRKSYLDGHVRTHQQKHNSSLQILDPSFKVETTFIEPTHEETESIPNENLQAINDKAEYCIIAGASKFGGDVLYSCGYKYSRDGKPSTNGDQRWRCTVRNSRVKCRGSVIQQGDEYQKGSNPHTCTPKFCRPKAKGKARKKRKTLIKKVIIKNSASMVDDGNSCSLEHGDPIPEPEEQYSVVARGSKFGGEVLISRPDGYKYSKDGKPSKNGSQRWRCSVRNKRVRCLASVIQLENKFTRGPKQHNCIPKFGSLPTANIKSYIRQEGMKRPSASGSTLVKEAIAELSPTVAELSSLPKMASLIRTTNRIRQMKEPKQPKSLTFTWITQQLPEDFVQHDFTVGPARHIVMFTPLTFALLSKAKTWYLDATFKAVQRPFLQLWSIQAFICQCNKIKLIPLVHILMSRRNKEDYSQVLQYIIENLAEIVVERVIMDFESCVWRALLTELPAVELIGCSYHWTQILWKKIKDEGLIHSYHRKKSTGRFLRQLLCLPFLPSDKITSTFQEFRDLVLPSHPAALHNLMDYIEDTLIDGRLWSPNCWSVFNSSIRTKYDVEAWHHRLDKLCRKHVNVDVYELIEVLYLEALSVVTPCQLVTEERLKEYQNATYKRYQRKIFFVWQEYVESNMSPRELLQRVSKYHHPFDESQEDEEMEVDT